MKLKSNFKRLALNKHTITNLNAELMATIVAGNAAEENVSSTVTIPLCTMSTCTLTITTPCSCPTHAGTNCAVPINPIKEK